MPHASVVHSLSPWKGERDRVRGGVVGLRMDLVNGGEVFPPRPGPLPLGGGEGECFADLGGFIVNLSSILRLHQWGQPVDRSNPNQPGPAATPPRAPRGRRLPAPRRALAAENPTALRTYSF